ncbi:sirohydrochlorin chelatase [Raineyella sp. LH-20]|uniref:sirohydrochlorin chelatase n=1 Tax=Raineyella sp. LH-20 TaxID=3081204 RepID=UPI002954E277|nr:CbiX/SirB N-terminal domain-containing protein [Raineyella sp. LH-20]WOP18204.1 CbiX/SirB N-terminal domain-containing protein [Raineyella sp. LH-20]
MPPRGGTVILAAHGSRDPAAAPVVQAIARAVADRLAARVEVGWLSTGAPAFADLAAAVAPDVVVPLLLGTGYHVLVDIPQALTGVPGGRPVVTPHLGPAGEVVAALADRVREVDPAPVAVVLAAAGTSHPVGRSETRQAGDLLSRVLGVPVLVAYASGAGPEVAEAVATLRASGARRVTVVPYLLAPGFFADRIAAAAGPAGATTAAVLGDHPQVTGLVARRIVEAYAAVPALREDRAA